MSNNPVGLGDQRVSIFVGSRYAQGQPIPPEIRSHQVRCVAGELARLFGGATAEDIERKAARIIGTFRHEANQHAGIVDEAVLRVWVAVTLEQLKDVGCQRAVIEEACRLRDALRQESVFVEWGREALLTPGVAHPESPVSFGALPKAVQEEFALMAWHRVTEPEDLYGVFSLGGWTSPTGEVKALEACAAIVRTKEGQARTVWHWRRGAPPAESVLRELSPGDLLVMEVPDERLRFWLRTPGTSAWAGPRDIPLATSDRPARRVAVEFVIAALEGDGRLSLAQVLDAEGTTARFYNDMRTLVEKVSKAAERSAGRRAVGIAQRLLGRLLFVRFVEAKGWLPARNMRKAWDTHAGSYYRTVLVPLFRSLDTPHASRKVAEPGVPYLNGGLFAARSEDDDLDLPDDFFDPNRRSPSLLRLLYDYDFTLDEAADRDQVVSVDPAMLGRVLEGLTPDAARKSKGVHYTPAPIARALALGGLVPQLARRMKNAGHAEVDEKAITRLLEGDRNSIGDKAAQCLSAQLKTLRIVDPAVGSGGLLVACLDMLLEIEAACERVVGGDLRRGSLRWATVARHFVRECLYGVDISAEAVEVAQLRLWLYLAVGEATATALPDLGYNLRVGDSLSFDAAEHRFEVALADDGRGTRKLEYDSVNECLNRALDARQQFLRSGDALPSQRAATFLTLEQTERDLRAALGGRAGRSGEAPPFAWAVHFPEVFRGSNRGFDLVIANPPYVRSSGLDPENNAQLRQHYRSMNSGNVDLYYAFVERCFRAPDPIATTARKKSDRLGLAGRAGSIAFILPSFAQTTSAGELRSLLAQGSHVDRWVDFVGLQVFPTASNFVALLFGTAERQKRSTFPVQIVTSRAFELMRAGQPWLNTLISSDVPYDSEGWNIRAWSGKGRPLGELATVEVGIQTSLDDFFLFERVRATDNPAIGVFKNAFDEVELENGALFPCAKGARDLHGDRLDEGCYVLWPYEPDGALMTEAALEGRFPLAWHYFLRHRDRLEQRERGKFRETKWWRFRRPQGVECAVMPKVIVPSIMREPTAFFDRDGRLICTASGKGGGGGWVIQGLPDSGLSLEKLAAFLRSDEYGGWLAAKAEPKRGGWWGVDRKTLEGCPIPASVYGG